jgi:hypothetical protein
MDLAAADGGGRLELFRALIGVVTLLFEGCLVEMTGWAVLEEGDALLTGEEMLRRLLDGSEWVVQMDAPMGGWVDAEEDPLPSSRWNLYVEGDGMAALYVGGSTVIGFRDLIGCPLGWRVIDGRSYVDVNFGEGLRAEIETMIRSRWALESADVVNELFLGVKKNGNLSEEIVGASQDPGGYFSHILVTGYGKEARGANNLGNRKAMVREAMRMSGEGDSLTFKVDYDELEKRVAEGGKIFFTLRGPELDGFSGRQTPFALFKLVAPVLGGVGANGAGRLVDRVDVGEGSWRKVFIRQLITAEEAAIIMDEGRRGDDNFVAGVRGFIRQPEADEYLRRGVLKAMTKLGLIVFGFMCVMAKGNGDTELVMVVMTDGGGGLRRRRALGWRPGIGFPKTVLWIAGMVAELFDSARELDAEPKLGVLAKQSVPYLEVRLDIEWSVMARVGTVLEALGIEGYCGMMKSYALVRGRWEESWRVLFPNGEIPAGLWDKGCSYRKGRTSGFLLAVGGRKHGKGVDIRDSQEANVIAWDGANAVFTRTLQVSTPSGPIVASAGRGLGAEGERRGAPRRIGDEKGRGTGRSSGSRAASKEAEPRWRRSSMSGGGGGGGWEDDLPPQDKSDGGRRIEARVVRPTAGEDERGVRTHI